MTDSGNLVDKVLNDIKISKDRKAKGKAGEKEEIAETRNRITRVRCLLALRSGYEKRVNDDMIDSFAELESQEACNGNQN